MAERWYPPPSRPLAVEGGLKAKSKRGAIGLTWWSTRFIAVLEDFGLGNRLTRGKAYARRGQVLDLDVGPGLAQARVQGSRRKPYLVRLGVRAFGKAEWASVAEAMAADAWYAAKLLSGEMPSEIEDLFSRVGLSLFPESARDLDMDCSCPDWEVPCKHIAAVFYLLAEAFDEDPFQILAWRGRDREALLAMVSAKRLGVADGVGAAGQSGRALVPALSDCLDGYWAGPSLTMPRAAGDSGSAAGVGGSASAVLDQLPPLDVLVRGVPLIEALRPAYSGSADRRAGH